MEDRWRPPQRNGYSPVKREACEPARVAKRPLPKEEGPPDTSNDALIAMLLAQDAAQDEAYYQQAEFDRIQSQPRAPRAEVKREPQQERRPAPVLGKRTHSAMMATDAPMGQPNRTVRSAMLTDAPQVGSGRSPANARAPAVLSPPEVKTVGSGRSPVKRPRTE